MDSAPVSPFKDSVFISSVTKNGPSEPQRARLYLWIAVMNYNWRYASS